MDRLTSSDFQNRFEMSVNGENYPKINCEYSDHSVATAPATGAREVQIENEIIVQVDASSSSVAKTKASSTFDDSFRKFLSGGDKMCGLIVNTDLLQNKIIPSEIYRCDECNETFSSKLIWSRHKYVFHPRQLHPKHQCDKCDQAFSYKHELTKHEYASHPKHRCIECDQAFKTKSDLTKHKHSLHLKLVIHSCAECQFCFDKRKDLIKHVKEAHRSSCRQCLKTVCECLYLKPVKFVTVNSRSRIFKCKLCPDTFSSMKLLKKHVNSVHDNAETFKCANCKSIFLEKTGLKRHMKSVHGVPL